VSVLQTSSASVVSNAESVFVIWDVSPSSTLGVTLSRLISSSSSSWSGWWGGSWPGAARRAASKSSSLDDDMMLCCFGLIGLVEH
jgi:hypothetical protein